MTPAKRAAGAALIVAAAALTATTMLWPGGVIETSAVALSDYFSAAELNRWDDFRGPQRLLGLAAAISWLAAVTAVLLRSPFQLRGRSGLGAAATGAAAVAAGFAASLPFGWVMTARAQAEGLVTQPQTAWLSDSLLGTAIAALIAACLLAALGALIRYLPRLWWAAFATVVVAGAALLSLVSPLVIEPLFADFREPADSALERDAETIAKRARIAPGRLLVVDASTRTGGVNAYVSGWGPTERIVFYDTLLNNFNRAQARGVLAHEIAHAKHDDVPRGLVWLALFAFPAAFAVSLVARPTDREHHGPTSLPAAAIALLAVGVFGTLASGPMSRQVEARADSTALRLTAEPDAARALTVRLARNNLGDPDPPAFYHSLFGSHPTISQRLGSIETYARADGAPKSREPAH